MQDSERLLQRFNAHEPLIFPVRQTQIDGHIQPSWMTCSISKDGAARFPRPLQPLWLLTDLDDRVPRPVRLLVDEPWVQILTDANDEFEVDDFAEVFFTWRVEVEDPLDIGDVDITDCILARAGRLAQDALMSDEKANQILAALPEGKLSILWIRFLRERAARGWFVEDNFDPIREVAKKSRAIVEI